MSWRVNYSWDKSHFFRNERVEEQNENPGYGRYGESWKQTD